MFLSILKREPLTLENTGSVARDHLAAERTFLAYVRTSLACASAGVALMQLFNLAVAGDLQPNLKRFSRPLGAVMVIFGLFVLSVGTTRYFTIQTALTHGKFPAARYTIALQTLFLCTVVVVVFAILVGVR
ncbi:hypothetical protein OF83DRAFT_1166982 [Amylostereum chailletii]|nr:hypothetical protein OF83DRAFT_1166982 [Amylostereum chailletii]